MPEKITAYRCKYRCGERPSTSEDTIIKHEKNCFHNPGRKACKICKHFSKDEEKSYDCGTLMKYCDIEKLPEGKNITYNCDFFE